VVYTLTLPGCVDLASGGGADPTAAAEAGGDGEARRWSGRRPRPRPSGGLLRVPDGGARGGGASLQCRRRLRALFVRGVPAGKDAPHGACIGPGTNNGADGPNGVWLLQGHVKAEIGADRIMQTRGVIRCPHRQGPDLRPCESEPWKVRIAGLRCFGHRVMGTGSANSTKPGGSWQAAARGTG
jgi:hypothetical protein